jgi:hypothetical protein
MDTASFFAKVLPAGGLKILAELVPYTDKQTGKTGEGWRYTTYQSFDAMAEAVAQFDAKGRTIYHACNSYNDWYFDEKKQKNRIRTSVNVVACRSIFDDIDCGKTDKETGEPVGHQTRAEAMAIVREIVKAGALPAPLVVYSGGGVHLYWPLTEDITPEEWLRLSATKRRITSHFGLMVDHQVDMDLARVLRPVGSRNHKYEDKPEVTPKNNIPPLNKDALAAQMDYFIEKNKVERVSVSSKASLKNAFAAALETNYEPSDPDTIAEHCAVIKWFKATGADSEPMWHKCLGVIKFAVDGEAKVHDWSGQYSGYDAAETQMKLDAWEHGPTTCGKIQEIDDSRCKGCKHNGKIKSPIQLGYTVRTETAEAIVAPETIVTPEASKVLSREEVIAAAWPKAYRGSDADDGWLIASVQNDDGTVTPVKISATVFWAKGWIQLEDGTWELGVGVRGRNGSKRGFTIPAAAMGSADKLVAALAAYGVFLESPKLGGFALKYMKDFYQNLQFHGAEVESVPAFGWADDMRSYVLGNRRFTETTVEEVHVTDNIQSSGMGIDFGVEGDRQVWVDTIDKIYNRPGAELYQYLFLLAAAAPLVRVASIPNFHGIPTALTGESGLGKTTTCEIACSIWGKGQNFTHASDSAGTTVQAMVKRVAIMRNAPRVFDEITGQKTEVLRDLFFALSNGQDKDRLNSSGNFATGGLKWDLTSFVTGNVDITGMLNNLDQQQKDAAMVRVFEIKLPLDFNEKLWKGELDEVKRLIAEVLPHTYGHVGRELIQYYIKKQARIRENILALRRKFKVTDREMIRERFYIDNLVVALVAGAIMKKLGIIHFDLVAIEKAVMQTILSLRAVRKATNYSEEEYVGQFLSWLYGKMLITKGIPNVRNGDAYETPIEAPRQGVPLARLATGDKRFIVTAKALNDWAKEFGGASAASIRDWMDKTGYILHIPGRESTGAWTCRIGQGTHIATGLSRCYELDYAKVFVNISEANVVPANVVSMINSVIRPSTESVPSNPPDAATA